MDAALFWSVEYLIGRWQPVIGDPTFLGWFTVMSYFMCSMVSIYAAVLNRNDERKAFFFWLIIGVLLVGLGINKQLDLQSLLTEIGRQIARAEGWYPQRRIVQFTFIAAFSTTSLAMFIWFTLAFRGLFRRFLPAFCGLYFLLGFVLIRAASFHHFDEVIQYDLHGIKMNWVLELAGIYVILLAGCKEIVITTIRNH